MFLYGGHACGCLHPAHPLILKILIQTVFAFAFHPVHPSILKILIQIAFALLFYYHIIIGEKTLDTMFLIAYN